MNCIVIGGISERSRYRTPGPKHRPLSGGFDCNSIGCQDGYTQFLSTLPGNVLFEVGGECTLFGN